MKLYHGTCGSHLPRILKKGITPRGVRKGNWPECRSHPECVYLTDAYAGYFALAASKKGRCVVFEIDTDLLAEGDMLPDEDFLGQVEQRQLQGTPDGQTLIQRTEAFREQLPNWCYTDTYKLSLQHLGTCAYLGTIPTIAITRYVTFGTWKNAQLRLIFDPTITLMNYTLLGPAYRRKTAWLFGDKPPEPGPTDIMSDLDLTLLERNDFRVVKLQKEFA